MVPILLEHAAEGLAHAVHFASLHADHGVHATAWAETGGVLHASSPGPIVLVADTVAQTTTYADKVKAAAQVEQLGWLSIAGKHFIGVFQKGGEVFASFVTGIIPTLVVLMTAFYAVTELVGEQRVHGLAQAAGRIALTRYTILPVIAMFFLTNPMAYTFGVFLEEKHKPAFYDSAVSFCHPITGLFPHANAGEFFVWGGVLVALQQLEAAHTLPDGWHVKLAIWYFGVGIVVILLKGILTERITQFLAAREGVEL